MPCAELVHLSRYTCCAVKTLEQFRTVVSSHLDLESESKLRSELAALESVLELCLHFLGPVA